MDSQSRRRPPTPPPVSAAAGGSALLAEPPASSAAAGAVSVEQSPLMIVASAWCLYGVNSEGEVFSNDEYIGTQNVLRGSGLPQPKYVSLEYIAPDLPKGARIAQIAAGQGHLSALFICPDRSTHLYSAGHKMQGQLMRRKQWSMGRMDNILRPVDVEALPPGSQIIKIAAGGFNTLALVQHFDGTSVLYSGGSNHEGQLGRAKLVGGAGLLEPVFIPALPPASEVVDMAVGANYIVVLMAHPDGTSVLYGAGFNMCGQLGWPSPELKKEPAFKRVLTEGLPVGAKITKIAAGEVTHILMEAVHADKTRGLYLQGCYPKEFGDSFEQKFHPGVRQVTFEPSLSEGENLGEIAELEAHYDRSFVLVRFRDGATMLYSAGCSGALGRPLAVGQKADIIFRPVHIQGFEKGMQISHIAAGQDQSFLVITHLDGSKWLYATPERKKAPPNAVQSEGPGPGFIPIFQVEGAVGTALVQAGMPPLNQRS